MNRWVINILATCLEVYVSMHIHDIHSVHACACVCVCVCVCVHVCVFSNRLTVHCVSFNIPSCLSHIFSSLWTKTPSAHQVSISWNCAVQSWKWDRTFLTKIFKNTFNKKSLSDINHYMFTLQWFLPESADMLKCENATVKVGVGSMSTIL